MLTKRIDKTLDNLIVNLKLTKPSSIEAFQKQSSIEAFQKQKHQQSRTQIKDDLPIFNTINYKEHPISNNSPFPQEDSLINDNYNDFNGYSFYELKQHQIANQQSQPQEFSFCNQAETKNYSDDDSLSRFSSIVDKLKTEGDSLDVRDSLDMRDSHFFYSTEDYQVNTDRVNTKKNGSFCGDVQTVKNTERRHTEYFSDCLGKSTQKTYKNLAKKTLEHNFSKPKLQPIYAKLTLPVDKENNHHNSNLNINSNINAGPKSSLMSGLSTRKSTYSSVMKKSTTQLPKNNPRQPIQSINKQRIKQLNQKIRKQNNIIYQSQIKQKNPDSTPLRSFKKTNIQPHKFSTYKVKLFG